MLKSRLLSAAIGGPLILWLIWWGINWTAALVALAATLGLLEFHRLSVRRAPTPSLLLGIAAVVLFSVQALVERDFLLPLITGAVFVPLFLLIFLPQKERLLNDWAWNLAGIFLIGWSLSHAIHIRHFLMGREWLLSLVLLTFAIDTTAYAAGRLFGRHHMAPTISPRKTWEGGVGGLVGGIAVAPLLGTIYRVDVSVWQMAVLGGLIAVFSQCGDLAMSVIKRAAGAKDASSLIPGHGGILDRLDSLIPAVLVLYYFLTYAIGEP